MRRRVGRDGATRGAAEGGGWASVVDLRLGGRLMRQHNTPLPFFSDDDGGDSHPHGQYNIKVLAGTCAKEEPCPAAAEAVVAGEGLPLPKRTITRCWAWASRAIPSDLVLGVGMHSSTRTYMALKLKLLLLNWRAAGGGGCCLRNGNGNAALPFPFPFPLGGTGNRRTSASSSTCRCSSSNLFVGGLSYDTNETALKEAFSQYGDVIAVKVICHPTTGKSKGFGFVNFSSQNQAAVALQNMNGQLLDGRNIRVHCATGTGGSAATDD